MKKMTAQVNFFCFLMFFSVWLAIWCLKISTIVLIKALLTYLGPYRTICADMQIQTLLSSFSVYNLMTFCDKLLFANEGLKLPDSDTRE